jgi:hypothetical protein
MRTDTGNRRNKKTGTVNVARVARPVEMHFELFINTDGDAFAPSPFPEIIRILRNVADRLSYGEYSASVPLYFRISDANGNAAAFAFYRPTDTDGNGGDNVPE